MLFVYNVHRFFRRVCDEYFRPGGFPPSSPPGEKGEGVPHGAEGEAVAVAGGGNGDGDGDGGGGGDGSAGWLRQAMLRADYVNSLNEFNQLAVSTTEGAHAEPCFFL